MQYVSMNTIFKAVKERCPMPVWRELVKEIQTHPITKGHIIEVGGKRNTYMVGREAADKFVADYAARHPKIDKSKTKELAAPAVQAALTNTEVLVPLLQSLAMLSDTVKSLAEEQAAMSEKINKLLTVWDALEPEDVQENKVATANQA